MSVNPLTLCYYMGQRLCRVLVLAVITQDDPTVHILWEVLTNKVGD